MVPALPPRTGSSYQKFANKASHYAVIGVAALVTLDAKGNCQRVRIGITGAGSRAVRARSSEQYLTGRRQQRRTCDKQLNEPRLASISSATCTDQQNTGST